MNVTLNPYVIGHKTANSIINNHYNYTNKIWNAPIVKDSFVKSPIAFKGTSEDPDTIINYDWKKDTSPLERKRLEYQPKLPPALLENINKLEITAGEKTESIEDQTAISRKFPKTYGQRIITFDIGNEIKKSKPINVGVVLSGGQAAGGHNVIAGIYDALKEANPKNKVFGFLNGPSGIIDGRVIELNDKIIDKYRNMGGFHMIGSGRTKLESEEQFVKSLAVCKKFDISAITIIGGDDSNTNAAILAEWFKDRGEKIQVIGCPKTIDGDLKNEQIETSFGFDTATKTYAETIGNIEKDAASAKKYWHFVKVMGRSASHVALEASLLSHPNITLISEEVAEKNISLDDIVTSMAETIAKRSRNGKNYGVAVIPEGLIEAVPDLKYMIHNLNDIMPEIEVDSDFNSANSSHEKFEIVEKRLDKDNAKVYSSLPAGIKIQLLKERDPHGNVQVSQIATEDLLIEMIKTKLEQMKSQGKFSGKFSALSQFSGYDGRSGLPTNFDCDYCYALGKTAAALVNSGETGYMATVKNLSKDTDKWTAGGTPLTMMMNMEKRHGMMKPVIKKALVDIEGPVFRKFEKNRDDWAVNDRYVCPGPIQFEGPKEVCENKPKTLMLEQGA